MPKDTGEDDEHTQRRTEQRPLPVILPLTIPQKAHRGIHPATQYHNYITIIRRIYGCGLVIDLCLGVIVIVALEQVDDDGGTADDEVFCFAEGGGERGGGLLVLELVVAQEEDWDVDEEEGLVELCDVVVPVSQTLEQVQLVLPHLSDLVDLRPHPCIELAPKHDKLQHPEIDHQPNVNEQVDITHERLPYNNECLSGCENKHPAVEKVLNIPVILRLVHLQGHLLIHSRGQQRRHGIQRQRHRTIPLSERQPLIHQQNPNNMPDHHQVAKQVHQVVVLVFLVLAHHDWLVLAVEQDGGELEQGQGHEVQLGGGVGFLQDEEGQKRGEEEVCGDGEPCDGRVGVGWSRKGVLLRAAVCWLVDLIV